MDVQRYDRRVVKTQRLLRESLFSLLESKSLSEITIRELTELADVNRSTFYFYYDNIYDMMEQIQNEIYETFYSSVIENEERPGDADSLMSYVLRFMFFVRDNCAMCTFLLKNDINHQLLEKIKADITEKLFDSADLYSANDPRRYFTEIGKTGIAEAIIRWMEDGMVVPPEEMARFLCQMYYGGKNSFSSN